MTAKQAPHGLTEWTITGTGGTGSATLPKAMAGMFTGGYFIPSSPYPSIGTTIKIYHPIADTLDMLGGLAITVSTSGVLPIEPYNATKSEFDWPRLLGFPVVTIGVNTTADAVWTLLLYTY